MRKKSIGHISATFILCASGCVAVDSEDEAVEAETAMVQLELRAPLLGPPPGCREVTLGELENGIELTPTRYGQQPINRGEFGEPLGAPDIADPIFVRLDSATSPGLYSLTGRNNNTFTCEQCVFGFEDAGPGQTQFVAESGTLLLAGKRSPVQTIGALFNVTLRESTPAPPQSAPYTGSEPVPGGQCLWIRWGTWNTVRDQGCDPRRSLPGLECVSDNYGGDDGTFQKPVGTVGKGEACTILETTGPFGIEQSSCETGLVCTGFTGQQVCQQPCDFLSASPGCGSSEVCGPFGVCFEQTLLESFGFDFDPAPVGSECLGPNPYAEFCGREGERGVCVDLDGLAPDALAPSICYPYERARSACASGEELGFVAYGTAGGGFDRSYGWCYEPLPPDPSPK